MSISFSLIICFCRQKRLGPFLSIYRYRRLSFIVAIIAKIVNHRALHRIIVADRLGPFRKIIAIKHDFIDTPSLNIAICAELSMFRKIIAIIHDAMYGDKIYNNANIDK